MSNEILITKVKNNAKILINNEPYVIITNEFIKPGKGQGFNRLKLKNIKNKKIITKTMKSNEKVIVADSIELELTFLYQYKQTWIFINENDSQQYEIANNIIEGNEHWIIPQWVYSVTFLNDIPYLIIIPQTITMKVKEVELSIKGNTVNKTSKTVVLENGHTMKVPLFIKENDIINIDTATNEYISRNNKNE